MLGRVRGVLDAGIGSAAVVGDSSLYEIVVLGAGAHIHRDIIDKDVVLEPGAKVGMDQ